MNSNQLASKIAALDARSTPILIGRENQAIAKVYKRWLVTGSQGVHEYETRAAALNRIAIYKRDGAKATMRAVVILMSKDDLD